MDVTYFTVSLILLFWKLCDMNLGQDFEIQMQICTT